MGSTPDAPGAWAARYVGLTATPGGRTREEGPDCWGLVRMVYGDELSVALPELRGAYEVFGDRDLAGRVADEMCTEFWRIAPGDPLQEFDVPLFYVTDGKAKWAHVAVMVDPERFLHADAAFAKQAEVIRMTDPRRGWSGRLVCSYRHRSRSRA